MPQSSRKFVSLMPWLRRLFRMLSKKASVADQRERNLIVHGMKEEKGEDLKTKYNCFQASGRATIVYSTTITSKGAGSKKGCESVPEQPGQCFYATREIKVAERDDGIWFHLSQSGQNI